MKNNHNFIYLLAAMLFYLLTTLLATNSGRGLTSSYKA
jgi:hypothetical protein